jgi:acyl-CoA synthetase (NDP forming)
LPEHALEPIFHPRGIALVGVPSSDGVPGSTGGSSGFLSSLMEQGFQEKGGLYPVNPKATQIRGLTCYPTLLDTPDPVDHVISLIPARAVPVLVDQAIQKKVRSIHFFTAGFSETGDPEMARMEQEVIGKLKAAGIRAVGPNCMGLYVPAERIAFMNGFPKEPGNVMMISQSGANAGDVVHGLGRRGVRFSKVVSFGNGIDIRAHDLFEYAAADPQTEVITAYIEGVQDGRKMFEAIKAAARVKPVILLKGGLTSAGARAAHSHTGSLAGSIDIFEALCRQTGAMRAETMDDLHDLVVAVNTSVKRVRGRGVALIVGGGGFAVLSSDAIATAGLEVPPTPDETKRLLNEFIPVAGTSVNNPIDTNMGTPDIALKTLRIVAAAPTNDVVIAAPNIGQRAVQGAPEPDTEERERQIREQIKSSIETYMQTQEETGTPVVALLRDRSARPEMLDAFAQEAYRAGIGTYPTVARAARAIALVLKWRERREGLPAVI